MGMLDALIGPFISFLDSVLIKRRRLDFGAGFVVTDDSANDCTRVVADGSALGGRPVDNRTTPYTGWDLAWDASAAHWTPMRGVHVVATGTVTINGDSPVATACAGIAAGDQIVYTIFAPSGVPQLQCFTVSLTPDGGGLEGGFSCAGSAGDDSTFGYMVLRPASGTPS